ncbi:MAG: YlmC/YmxH family sporulation protein [Oscillospiraceae bacterium]|nr:YlmC/YmxH family sporulation protein [Oscillospiraceae bacterium]
MLCTLSELCQKEVINIDTAERLGFIADVEINTETGEMVNICVFVGGGFFKPKHPIKIARCNIVKIGVETVLVKNVHAPAPSGGKRLPGFFK